jgi:NhaP-type Na+/H+ or K+/H+ antiporter
VSLAAARSLPASLLERDLLIVLSFGVVLITLLSQRLTVCTVLERVAWYGAEEPNRR